MAVGSALEQSKWLPPHSSSSTSSSSLLSTKRNGASHLAALAAPDGGVKSTIQRRAQAREINNNEGENVESQRGGVSDKLARDEPAGGAGQEPAASSKAASRGRGLLEALLGERGKSWLEQRTVILDIQNERSKDKEQQHERERKKLHQIPSGGVQQVTKQQRDQPTRRPAPIVLTRDTSGADLRVPTFGSVPLRLTRLPYFSYQGKAKNVELARPTDRLPHLNGAAARGSAVSVRPDSASGSSSTSASSASQSSGQLRLASTASSTRSSPAAKFPRGFSNISNLFSNTARRKTGAPNSFSTSTLIRDGDNQLQSGGASASARRKSTSQTNLSTRQQQKRLPAEPQMNRRRNSFAHLVPGAQSSQQQQLSSSTLLYERQQQQPMRTRSSQSIAVPRDTMGYHQQPLAGRARQLGGGSGGSALGPARRPNSSAQYPRRPVSSAGNHPTRSPTAGRNTLGHMRSSSYRFDSPYGPPVDPDCPVHGDEPMLQQQQHQHLQRPATIGRRFAAQARGTLRAARSMEQAASQPELLFEGEPDADLAAQYRDHFQLEEVGGDTEDYQPLGWARDHEQATGAAEQTRHRSAAPAQIYSPLSPQANLRASQRAGLKQQQQQQQQAYYNGSSRFSIYHPSSDGIQSSLAPTSEQLRRILGYKPLPAGARPVHLHPQWAYSRPFIHLQPANSSRVRRRGGSSSSLPAGDEEGDEEELLEGDQDELEAEGPRFWPFNRLQDAQAIRAVDFHPNGEVYAIGSNSRALRICAYPAEHELSHFNPLQDTDGRADHDQADNNEQLGTKQQLGSAGRLGPHNVKPPRVLFKFLQVHRGSIYCVSFNPSGQLLATGSNDQTVHLVKYNSVTHNPDGDEFRLTMHNGTVRDLCFIDDSFGSGSSLLLSAGGGDNKIFVTDCDTVTPYQSMAGHTQMVMALNHCGGAQFVSGSYDKTIRFWDLRTRTCTSIVSAPAAGGGGGAGPPVSALRVDPSARLLASGHTDSTCMLYDIRGAKIIQTFRPHDDEIRTISFSPKSYYLLTGSYDGRLVVSDLQGDLTRPLPSACVAECHDKIVQAKWHPTDFTFVSTSADKSATLWALPGELM